MAEMRKTAFMLLPPAPDVCQVCAAKHDPMMPHNRDSLCYQYKFYDKHGRWPTWTDAMEHCPQEVKEVWAQALSERGVKLD